MNNLPAQGTYRAFLNTSAASAPSRFSTSGPPWARLDHVLINPSAADITKVQNNWLAMPDQLSDGSYPTTPTSVQTFWGRSGTGLFPGTSTCADWTSTQAPYIGVYSTTTAPNYGSYACNASASLLCLQQ
jgi:hypothetical protein